MTGPTWLLAVGLIVWLIAQALPATHGGYPVLLVVTLVGWGFAILGALLSVSLEAGILGLVGWTANLWLLGALVARRRGKLSRALGLSWVALLCALAEVVFLYLLSGGTHCCDLNAIGRERIWRPDHRANLGQRWPGHMGLGRELRSRRRVQLVGAPAG
jgi:hypothetical protein